MSSNPSIFLTTSEVADRWSLSRRTLEGWRDKGTGPNFHKIGGRGGSVRYHIDDVERFERAWTSHFNDTS